MKSSPKRHGRLIDVAMLFFLITSACQASPDKGQKAWIDAPFANSSFRPGSPIHLVGHAYAENRIAEVQLSIDGVPYSRGAPSNPGERLAMYAQDVIISEPGEHTIEVVAYDAQGAPSSPVSVQVRIFANTQPAPTLAVTGTPSIPTLTPYVPPPTLAFTSTPSIPALTPYVPPPPADTQPPVISASSHTPDKIWDFANCGADTLSISATIADPSGISNAQVHFRVVKGGTTGSWVTIPMSGSGSHFQAAVGPNQLMNSLSKYGGGVQYYITAADSKGNTAQSGQSAVEIRACML